MNINIKIIGMVGAILLTATSNTFALREQKGRNAKSATAKAKANLEQELMDAIYNENISKLRSLLKKIDVNEKLGGQDKTPLMFSVAFEKLCVECTADFATQQKHLKTPSKAVVEELLQAGADIKKTNGRSKQTALHFAAAGNKETVQLLLNKGGKAILEARDKSHNTPLHYAEQNLETLKALLDAGANVNAQDIKGNTALSKTIQELSFNKSFNITTPVQHRDFRRLIKSCVELLIKYHANVNLPNKKGMTPLMYAAYYGIPEIVEILLEAGALVNLRNNKGLTALQLAQNEFQEETAEESTPESGPMHESDFKKVIALLTK